MAIRFGSFKSRVLMTSSAAVLGLALTSSFGSVAFAQDAAAEGEEIVVTGSRIVRRDFTANSPILTLDSQTFENTSTGAIETNLNKLPQFTPAVQSAFTAQDVQNTVVNTPGSANISLRGLGPNRNLVLIDGRRAMPTNGAMLVDVNSIPAAMIDRLEVITGGASAVYGADAISGVANFILKRNFQGLNVDTSYGVTQLSDGKEFRISGLIGGNFADDRGNGMLAVEHFTRGQAYQKDRDFYTEGWRNPNVAGTDFWPTDTYYNPGFFGNTPAQATVDGIFLAVPAGSVGANSLFMINQGDGTVYTGMPQFGGNGLNDPDGAYRYTGGFSDRVALRDRTASGAGPGLTTPFKVNEPEARVVAPLERYSAFATGHFDVNDWLTGFLEASFSQTHTTTFLQYSPAVNAWGVFIPHGTGAYAGSWVDTVANGVPDAGEAFAPGFGPGGAYGLSCTTLAAGCTNSEVFPTPTELALLLDSRADPNAPWHMSRNLNFLPQRQTDNVNTTYQVVAGFEGSIPNTDWTWELYASHGRSAEQTLYKGFGSLEGYRAIVRSPNYGVNAKIVGNSNPATNPGNAGFAAGTVNCTSGLPIFGSTAISADCIEAISANLQNQTAMEQSIVEANIQGGLFDNWAGSIRYALGASYRENDYYYIQDTLDSQNNALNSTIGLFPSNNTQGYIDVSEIYGELLLPLLSDLPFVKALNLEAGWRYSDYSQAGGQETYKLLGDYTVNDWLRFRGGYNRATRAPNIGELFQAKAQSVAFAVFGDPCTLNGLPQSGGGFNPNWGPDSASAPQAAAALAICSALMGVAGAGSYYAVPVASQPVNVGFSLALPNNVGNPNLDPEVADTWTVGVVIKSPFEDPLLNRLSASIDWYSIELNGLITAEAQDTVYQNCLDLTRNVAADPTIPACAAIIRDQVNGAVQTVNTSFVNAGGFETEGIDAQIDWAVDLADLPIIGEAPGTFSVNFLMNYIDTLAVAVVKGGAATEFKGTMGPNTGGLNAPAFEYRTFTTFGYSVGPASLQLRWRHTPETDPVPPAATTALGPAAHDEFDLSANYTVGDHLSLRAGIDNLLDEQPEITASNSAVGTPAYSTGKGITLPAVYDVLGRRFFVGMTVKY